jgi:SAM-dependent methyltransferase
MEPEMQEFKRMVGGFGDGYRALELGTRRWGDKPTHHSGWLDKSRRGGFGWGEWVKSDFMAGEDVDVVVDAHKLELTFGPESFDLVWASSVFEHLEFPWVAAKQIGRVLKPGGMFFIQTHQTFPIHGYPQDFYRFSRQALESLFSWAEYHRSFYEYPCAIACPEVQNMDRAAPAFLNVCIFGQK